MYIAVVPITKYKVQVNVYIAILHMAPWEYRTPSYCTQACGTQIPRLHMITSSVYA